MNREILEIKLQKRREACLKRPSNWHKGNSGTVIVVGGSLTMPGAPSLVARAAFRAGAGLVKLAVPASILQTVLGMQPSATGIALSEKDAVEEDAREILEAISQQRLSLAIGPGWGTNWTYQSKLLTQLCAEQRRMVIDADGLNTLAHMKCSLKNLGCVASILSPHPGEMKRLLKAAQLSIDLSSDQGRIDAAISLSNYHQAVVILKGEKSVVAHRDAFYVNESGHQVMATAGSGDVLTGVIAALMARETASSHDENEDKDDIKDDMAQACFEVACLGTYWHGLAGENWAQKGEQTYQLGMLATELADQLPFVDLEK